MLFGKHVNKYYLKYALFIFIGIVALLAVDYAQLLLPEYYGAIIDGLKSRTLDVGKLALIMRDFALVAFVMFIGRFGWRYFINGTSARIEADIRESMFVHSEKLSQRYFTNHKTGALMALFTNDLNTVRQTLGFGTIMLIDALFLGTLSFIKMAKLNWQLALIATIPLALMAIVSGWISKTMSKKWKARQEAFELLSDFAQENFSGISVIKAFVKQQREISEFQKINQQNVDKNVDFIRFGTLINVLINAFITSIILIIVGGCSYLVYQSEVKGIGEFTVGKLTEYIAYFSTLIWPMMAIARLINLRAQASASLKRISELLDEKVEIFDAPDVDYDHEIEGKIEFKDLTFEYPTSEEENRYALKNVSFVLNKGESLGIIGRTGCGKTTLVDLLLRIYNVPNDMIFIDDIDIMKLPFKKIRGTIGYVPQDNFLFSDTIRNNIAFAFKDIALDEVIKYATLADVNDNIMEFKDQYDTVLGERGVTISGGQKQRISIARALIKDPQILILDDSVSAVDTKTEEVILENLDKLRSDKTTILIAHRISTVKTLDKILILDKGEVAGFGTHDELIANNPMYQEMVRLQALEEEVNGGDYHDE